MRLTLADELLLLALDAAGRPRGGRPALDYALAGALLAELSIEGRVDVAGRRVTVRYAPGTGDPVLDGTLAVLAGSARQRKPRDWVARLSRGLRGRLLDRLVAGGILRRSERRLLGVFPVARYVPAGRPGTGPDAEVRARLDAAVRGTASTHPRTAALAAIIRAARLEAVAFPGHPKRELHRRLDELSRVDWASDAVRRAIQEVQAAVATAVVVSSVSAANN